MNQPLREFKKNLFEPFPKILSISFIRNDIYILILGCIFAAVPLSSQVYLQLEKTNSLNVRKYQAGDFIQFKTKRYPDAWQSGSIYKIIPEDEAVFFEDRIFYVPEVTHFSFRRPVVDKFATSVAGFGAAWLLFGGIIEGGRSVGVLDTEYRFGTDTAIIGGTALLSGYLAKTFWAKAVKKMGKRNRVRIVDLRL